MLKRIIMLVLVGLLLTSIVTPIMSLDLPTAPTGSHDDDDDDREDMRDRAEALAMLNRAQGLLSAVEGMIQGLIAGGVTIPEDIYVRVDNASALIDDAWTAFDAKNYSLAIELAENAVDILEDVMSDLEDLPREDMSRELMGDLSELKGKAEAVLAIIEGLPAEVKANMTIYIEILNGIIEQCITIMNNISGYSYEFVHEFIDVSMDTVEDIMKIINIKHETLEEDASEVQKHYNDVVSDYEETLSKVEELRAEGYDVSILENLLKSVEVLLNEAKDKIDKGLYIAASAIIESADGKLELVERFIEDIKEGVKGFSRDVGEDYVVLKRDGGVTKIDLTKPIVEFGVDEEDLVEGKLVSLVEFIDVNMDGIPQADEIVASWKLNELSWSVSIDISAPEKVVIEYVYVDPSFTLRIVYTLHESTTLLNASVGQLKYIFSLLGGGREVKIDIYLEGYVWVSEDSMLAITGLVDSKEDIQFKGVISDGDAVRVLYTASGYNVSISYLTVADVDGVPIPVNVNITQTGNNLSVYFVFEKFTGNLHYDPTFSAEPLIKPESFVDEEGAARELAVDIRLFLAVTLFLTLTILLLVIKRRS